MHFRKSCLEFEVSAADEVKVLLKAWYQVLVLQFLAPQELLDRLLDELGARGLECAIHNVIPGFLTRGRVKKKLD
jgi:hypothetical protein